MLAKAVCQALKCHSSTAFASKPAPTWAQY
nr:CxxxxCH/CxxCH domain-containing protein [Pseudomonas pergaminensis]